FTSDRGAEPGHGRDFGRPDVQLEALSEEHGWLRLSDPAAPLAVGDRLRFVPNHACTVMNLHNRVYGVRGDTVECEIPVDARGRVQ
ncbi:MAG: D-TA family PLP-dependent enzyme, partial [Chloroflexales bacterium]|nr:D-TA family PLP-dependent enzyme [Chloroflexales bacterium]